MMVQEVLSERMPVRELKYLMSMTYKDFKEIGKTNYKNEDECKKHYEMLKQMCKVNIKNNGVMNREYKYSSDTVESLGGRLYAGNGVQGLPKKIRGFLMKHTTDIDMKNAHPVILLYLTKKHSINAPSLEYYVYNRDALIGTSGTKRDELKTAYLKALNDKKVNYNVKDPFFRKFDNEMKMLQKTMSLLPEYSDILKSVPTEKNNNLYGSCLNRILCMYENKILKVCKMLLIEKNIEIAVNMMDGCMVYGDYYNDSQLLVDIKNRVESEFNGLNMDWDYKRHDDTIKIPEDFDESKYTDESFVKNDMEATEKVFNLYPHWKYCNGDLYVFDDKNGMWSSDKSTHFSVIRKFEKQLYYDENKSYGNTLTQMEKIPVLMKLLCLDDNWLNQKGSSSLGRVLFNNGYYDFKEEKFYNEFNPDIVFFGKIPHDFTNFPPEEMDYMEDIKKRFFYDTLGGDVGDYFIETLSRALAGDVQKRIILALGETNTGKSILTKALQLSLGDYVGGFNAENLAYRNSTADEAQNNRWAMLLRNKRIILSNEIKSNCELNGNAIKKISNGGSDMLIGRGHGGNEEAFTPHFLPVVFANDLPKITPYDDAVDNRVRVMSYIKKFVDEPKNEMELKKDDNIKEELQTLTFQRCLVGILIMQYMKFTEGGAMIEPIEVKQAKKDWIGDEVIGGVIENFINDYEITNDENDYVLSADIDVWLNEGKYGITMKKFGMEMKKYTALNRLDKVKSDNKKIDGKVKKAWYGIKLK